MEANPFVSKLAIFDIGFTVVMGVPVGMRAGFYLAIVAGETVRFGIPSVVYPNTLSPIICEPAPYLIV